MDVEQESGRYATESELAEKLEALVMEYAGEISTVATVGILEVMKRVVLDSCIEE
jgi:hypothetical protein